MKTRKITALFGGTFDPVHYGHIKPILALAKEFDLSKIYFMPNNTPPHKPPPLATAQQRLEMLTLALKEYPLLDIEYYEINKDESSYTIDTLKHWRNVHGKTESLVFIIGEDTLATLDSWKDWQTILKYCHLIVCPRPGFTDLDYDPKLKQWIKTHESHNISLLYTKPRGYIFFAHTPLYQISATTIREQLANDENCDDILPSAVSAYIKQHKLYE